jgi:hypothetical protein
MSHIPFSTNPDNIRRSPAEVTAIDVAIVNETIKVLKHRGDFSESALHDYVADSRTLVDLPDVISAEWLHKTAGDVADAFLAWAATGGAS